MRKLTLGFLLLCIIIIFWVWYSFSKPEKIEPIVRPVKTMLVNSPESSTMRVFPGKTLATNESTLAFQIPGQILKFNVLEGDHVNKGKIIAELDPVKYQEKVNETSANLARDKANFKRASTLLKDQYISVADYDKVQSAYLVSQANYNTALTDLKNSRLETPFDGIIAKTYVKNYEFITAKQPIILLQDKDQIDLEINVPENVIVNFKSNKVDKEKMYAIFDAVPNKEFKISLKEFSTQADPQTQTFRIVFTMKRPENLNILPGMTVSIHAPIGGGAASSFYIIPSSAVFVDEANQSFVWMLDKNSMEVKKVPVKVSNLLGDQIRVSSGLKSGDLIVISGVHFLTEGQKVTIMK